ncbi:hypothetical protein F0U44_04510 [Nocardioides humilatus]|uniref:Uncharacterized protein n=1 Tax=Nocardioides humilatus TaxID=2607660 RepID=A0A5B1LM16_9ACTN|nr:hypothetical protein [Nocardioides humilatus]KAA1421554.1 hypothetical protein F0U44_04510 [Nocardioides humilatus]
MSAQLRVEGLLLPSLSMALLGGGAEGADLLAELRLSSDNFERDLAEMLEALDGIADPEAPRKRAVSERLAELASGVTGWLAVTSLTNDVYPSYVLRRGDLAVVVRPIGPVAEWLMIGVADVVEVVQAAIDDFPDDVLLSARRGGEPCGSVLIRDGEAGVAAKDQATLDALSEGARHGLAGAVGALMELIDGPS